MISTNALSIAVLVVTVSASSVPVCADQGVRVGTDSKVEANLSMGLAMSIKTLARRASLASGEFDRAQTPVAPVATPPAKSWRQRHPVATGALLGAAIGVPLGAIGGNALAKGGTMVEPAGAAIVVGGMGAGVGSIVGLLAR